MSKRRKQKILVLFVVFLFFGSTVASAILGRGPTYEPPSLPEQKILTTELTAEEESFIVSQGYILLKTQCSNCAIDLLAVESLVRKYSPYIYLVKQESSNTTVDLLSYRNVETIESLNSTKIEDFICENALVKFNSCIMKALNSTGFNRTIPI